MIYRSRDINMIKINQLLEQLRAEFGLEPNKRLSTTILETYYGFRYHREAIEFYKNMVESKIEIDEAIVAIMIRVYSYTHGPNFAESYMKKMVNSLARPATIQMWTSVIRVLLLSVSLTLGLFPCIFY